jgi:hypothetical protein
MIIVVGALASGNGKEIDVLAPPPLPDDAT